MFIFNQKGKDAFTLAEVLITLGIIGIVAAMTLPVLIQNYKKKEATTRLKKFYSSMSQAIMLSENDNGPSAEWNKEPISKKDDVYDNESNRNSALLFFNKYLKPYIKYIKIDENPLELQDETGQSPHINVSLSDGVEMQVRNGSCTDLIVDINGKKLPNKQGRDKFYFVICPSDKAVIECGGNKNWCSYCTNCNTRASAKSMCISSASLCTRLLMMDGWEFKEDYPYKL